MELTDYPESVQRVAQERLEHITKHGRTIDRDVVENQHDELRKGAIALVFGSNGEGDITRTPFNWDSDIVSRMFIKRYSDRLIIAASLLLAEYDRIKAIQEP